MERTLQRKIDGEWIDIAWADLKKEMIIRMFEPSKEPVSFTMPGDSLNYYEMLTLSDAYKVDNIWTVDICKVKDIN
jgi:hypothetical protein